MRVGKGSYIGVRNIQNTIPKRETFPPNPKICLLKSLCGPNDRNTARAAKKNMMVGNGWLIITVTVQFHSMYTSFTLGSKR